MKVYLVFHTMAGTEMFRSVFDSYEKAHEAIENRLKRFPEYREVDNGVWVTDDNSHRWEIMSATLNEKIR